MNEYTYKVEFVAEYTNPRNGQIETDLWFGTVYRNGEQIEQHCDNSERRAIAACESTIKYEQKKDAIAEQLGVSLETAEGRRAVNDAIIAGNIKNMEAHGEIISTEYFGKPAENRQPRKRFVEDQFGEIVEEIEVIEETKDDSVDLEATIQRIEQLFGNEWFGSSKAFSHGLSLKVIKQLVDTDRMNVRTGGILSQDHYQLKPAKQDSIAALRRYFAKMS